MIENSTLRIGGNTLLVWFGKSLDRLAKQIQQLGNDMIVNNSPTLVTNPSAKLYNPFTLVVSFTVNGIEKYQLVQQGNYKQIFKDGAELSDELSENELFMIINQNRDSWYLKN